MNHGLLPANARLPELPSTYRAEAGAFSEGRRWQVVLWAGTRARKITGLGLDEVFAAGTRGEKYLREIALYGEIRNSKPENQPIA